MGHSSFWVKNMMKRLAVALKRAFIDAAGDHAKLPAVFAIELNMANIGLQIKWVFDANVEWSVVGLLASYNNVAAKIDKRTFYVGAAAQVICKLVSNPSFGNAT
jgi:hypothetical protein